MYQEAVLEDPEFATAHIMQAWAIQNSGGAYDDILAAAERAVALAEGVAAAEEYWSAPDGGSIMGMFRMTPRGKSTLYEFLLIEENGDGVALRFRHYGRKFKDIDEKPLHLKLARAGDKQAVFENVDGNQPKRIIYRIDESDLVAFVESTRDDGTPESFSLRFSKVTDAP